MLRGSVIQSLNGNGVTVDFGGAQSQSFTFTSTAPSADLGGTGLLRIFNKSVNVGDTPAAISGDLEITSSSSVGTTATPEPATVALMATGLIALAGIARRRRA